MRLSPPCPAGPDANLSAACSPKLGPRRRTLAFPAGAWPMFTLASLSRPMLLAPPGLEHYAPRNEDAMTRTPSAVSNEESDSLPSIGSFGHPEFCAAPCVYFSWGPCPKGAHCAFCHLIHREAPGKLDKRQRKLFLRLEEAEMVALLLPHLKERAKRLAACWELEHVFAILESRAVRHQPTLTERKMEKVNYVLRLMSFHALIHLILIRKDFEELFLERLTTAVAQLRALSAEAKTELYWL